MLKALDTGTVYTSSYRTKCAEVFMENTENFLIVCTHCELEMFEFNDFLLHFNNSHVHNRRRNPEDVLVKFESEIDSDALEAEYEGQKDANIGQIAAADNQTVEDYDNYSRESESSDEHIDHEDDQVPRILKSQILRSTRNRLKCQICNKEYKLPNMLEQHIRKLHSDSSNYKCAQCERVFLQECTLKEHLRKDHISYQCSQCDKIYKSKDSLHTHQFIHTGIRKFVCSFENCDKAFFNPKQLYCHKRLVHTVARNFICEACGFRTKTKAALIVHTRSHTGEKPFKCNLCSKGFASQSLLIEHQPTHSTERPHKCETCGATFSRPKALYHHKHLHLEVKKYICKICDKAYAQAAGLSGHMRTQHRNVQFQNFKT